jgi:hypothetical protein
MRTLPRDPDGGLYVVVSNRMEGDHQVFSGEGRLLPGAAWVEGDDDSLDFDYSTQPDWLFLEIGFARWEADKVWDKPSDD